MTASVLFISLTISPSVAGSNDLRGGDRRPMMIGGLADAVDMRMLSTLLWKNFAKSSAVSLSVACC